MYQVFDFLKTLCIKIINSQLNNIEIMAQKINFTREHLAKLKELCVRSLFKGTMIKGLVGTTINIYDLIHNTTLNTLTSIHSNLKKEEDKIQALDEWSMTDYQQAKLVEVQKTREMVNLIIGYKRHQAEADNERAKLSQLKASLAELKAQAMTPEEKIKALEDAIEATSVNEVEDLAI